MSHYHSYIMLNDLYCLTLMLFDNVITIPYGNVITVWYLNVTVTLCGYITSCYTSVISLYQHNYAM